MAVCPFFVFEVPARVGFGQLGWRAWAAWRPGGDDAGGCKRGRIVCAQVFFDRYTAERGSRGLAGSFRIENHGPPRAWGRGWRGTRCSRKVVVKPARTAAAGPGQAASAITTLAPEQRIAAGPLSVVAFRGPREVEGARPKATSLLI